MLNYFKRIYKKPVLLDGVPSHTQDEYSKNFIGIIASVCSDVDGDIVHTAADGNGPVNALDLALRKALIPRYPQLADFQLADYKVRIPDSNNGTAATTRVLIDTQDHHTRWSTVGAGANIIQASWLALVDSVEYGLVMAPQEAQKPEVTAATGD